MYLNTTVLNKSLLAHLFLQNGQMGLKIIHREYRPRTRKDHLDSQSSANLMTLLLPRILL